MMKKNLIAAAALLATAGAANAQMSVYGLIDMCYGKSLYADVLLNEKADVHSGGDNGSSECNSTTRFGLKGSYEVAKGVKANFKLESGGISSDGSVNGDGAFFRRAAWAGFSGSLGEIRVGRQDSIPFQMMGDFDFNGQSNGVSAGAYSGVGSWNTGRQSRSIQYIAPAMGGLSAQIGLRPKGNSQDGDKDVISGAVKFAAGPVLVGASYESKPDSAFKDFSSVAGSFDLGVAKFMASYADGGFNPVGNQSKGYMLGVTAPLAGFTVGAHYADSKDTASVKIKSYELFINKEIFKNTYAYLEGGKWKANADGGEGGPVQIKGSGAAIGVIFVF
jgi:predicted porin